MTNKELYLKGKKKLIQAGTESPAFDAVCLFEHCTGLDRQALIMQGENEASKNQEEEYLSCIKRRSEKEPLQYIIGKWEFKDCTFLVGEGVLIPREDTETAVNKAMELLKGRKDPIIADLCAGSGAIAVSLGAGIPKSTVTAVELSDEAFSYLQKNIQLNNVKNVKAVKADVLNKLDIDDESLELLISNPPYIKREELDFLQEEVKKEPSMALDGGEDGCFFYREIIKNHQRLIKHGGYIVFEVGENQYAYVEQLLLDNGFKNIGHCRDLGNTERCVFATRI